MKVPSIKPINGWRTFWGEVGIIVLNYDDSALNWELRNSALCDGASRGGEEAN